MKASDWILSRPWAMTPEMVSTIISIADRANEPLEAVAAKLGKPLDNTRTVAVRDGVAVIPVTGPIARYAPLFQSISGATSTEVLAQDIAEASANPDIKAIVLEIDSPGGQATGIAELASQIRSATASKPVIARAGGDCCSAAYWIASACTAIVADPTAILGSIGVVWGTSVPSADEKKRTIQFVSSQSPNKRLDPESKDGKTEIQRIVDDMAAVFISSVAEYRGIKESEVVSRFRAGGVLLGGQAVKAGMADRLGSLESVIAEYSGNSSKSKHKEDSMKFNMSKLFTGWLGKGKPDVMDSAEIAEASAEPENATTESKPVESEKVASMPLDVVLSVDSSAVDAARESLRKEFRAEKAAMFGELAKGYFALHANKVTPAEVANLTLGYVGAAMLDSEAPIEGYSFLGAFRASVESRKPLVAPQETVTGDATEIGNHLAAHNLKTLDSAAGTPAEADKLAEMERFRQIMSSTEEGRRLLAEMEGAAE